MNIFRRREQRAEEALLRALVGTDGITRAQALGIPSVAACVELISGTLAMLPVKLYRDAGARAEEIRDDPRVFLLNDEPGGLMDANQTRRAWVADYLLDGAGYLFIERARNTVTGLRYVAASDVSAVVSPGPIYKSAELYVGGEIRRDFEFVKLTRHSRDGVTGTGIVAEHADALAVAYNALLFENRLVKTGGNKKGFLKSEKQVTREVMEQLKQDFRRLYQNSTENVIVLNKGLDFVESSNTSVEMQLNENKRTNAAELCKLFCTPPSIVDGTAGDEDYSLWVRLCLAPVIAAMEAALNRDLLLESEKHAPSGALYFAVDTKDLLKGDVQKRFAAYQMAVESNIMSVDEVRYREDLPPYGLDFIKLGLQDVLYNPKTKEVYTPNTGLTEKLYKQRRASDAH